MSVSVATQTTDVGYTLFMPTTSPVLAQLNAAVDRGDLPPLSDIVQQVINVLFLHPEASLADVDNFVQQVTGPNVVVYASTIGYTCWVLFRTLQREAYRRNSANPTGFVPFESVDLTESD